MKNGIGLSLDDLVDLARKLDADSQEEIRLALQAAIGKKLSGGVAGASLAVGDLPAPAPGKGTPKQIQEVKKAAKQNGKIEFVGPAPEVDEVDPPAGAEEKWSLAHERVRAWYASRDDISHNKAARLIGTQSQQLAKYLEEGANPRTDTKKKIEKALGIPVDQWDQGDV